MKWQNGKISLVNIRCHKVTETCFLVMRTFCVYLATFNFAFSHINRSPKGWQVGAEIRLLSVVVTTFSLQEKQGTCWDWKWLRSLGGPNIYNPSCKCENIYFGQARPEWWPKSWVEKDRSRWRIRVSRSGETLLFAGGIKEQRGVLVRESEGSGDRHSSQL